MVISEVPDKLLLRYGDAKPLLDPGTWPGEEATPQLFRDSQSPEVNHSLLQFRISPHLHIPISLPLFFSSFPFPLDLLFLSLSFLLSPEIVQFSCGRSFRWWGRATALVNMAPLPIKFTELVNVRPSLVLYRCEQVNWLLYLSYSWPILALRYVILKSCGRVSSPSQLVLHLIWALAYLSS